MSAAPSTPALNTRRIYFKDDGCLYTINEAGLEEKIWPVDYEPIYHPLGGQWLMDPNEINGWGVLGPIDQSNTQDLGNVGAANLNRLSGGLVYPFDVVVQKLFAWHRNNNGDALAWGWVITQQEKNGGSNTVTTSYILDEVADNAGVGPRDYSNNQNQLTDITLTNNIIVPAGNVITLSVAAPTAIGTNRFVQVQSGYLQIQRV